MNPTDKMEMQVEESQDGGAIVALPAGEISPQAENTDDNQNLDAKTSDLGDEGDDSSAQAQNNQDDDFGNFQSAPSAATSNVKWLSNQEKGLIDFSDFSSEAKSSTKSQNQKKGTH